MICSENHSKNDLKNEEEKCASVCGSKKIPRKCHLRNIFLDIFERKRKREKFVAFERKRKAKNEEKKYIRKLRIQMTKHLQTFDTKRIFVFDLCFFVFKWNENELFPQSFRFDDAHTAKLLLFSTLSLRKIAHFFFYSLGRCEKKNERTLSSS